jgi:pyridoxine/pyridoxamine 5'-phosphate oxidase
MNMIGEFAQRIIGALVQFIDWSLSHWAVTVIVLVTMIYWAGKQRRLHRHHL